MRQAHRIIAMDKGRIAEAGTYDARLKHGGLYTHLWRTLTAVSDTTEKAA